MEHLDQGQKEIAVYMFRIVRHNETPLRFITTDLALKFINKDMNLIEHLQWLIQIFTVFFRVYLKPNENFNNILNDNVQVFTGELISQYNKLKVKV